MTVQRRLVAVAFALAVVSLPLAAQLRVAPLDEESGHVALGLALRHLANTGIFMQATAHPDDENNGLLVMLDRGQGYRTALATATRGNGGQNEIGPELFEALGVLRTEELGAVHRFDGTEQYFTRAVDFGYSFSIDETFEKWGRDEIIGDYVRLIRTIRPDVIIALRPDGDGGGQHHQASAVLAHEAYKLAGSPTGYPDQLRQGLRPWQPRKFYFATGFGGRSDTAPPGARVTSINTAVYDPLLGRTYSEIGTEARSMHKCQGMAQLLALPGPATASYRLTESTIPGQQDRDEKSLFDGVDTSIGGLARFAGPKPPKELVEGLSALSGAIELAEKRFDSDSDQAAFAPLLSGLHAVRVLRGLIRGLAIDEAARFEIDFRLRQKERELQQAALIANPVRVDALADDGLVVPGQSVKLTVIIANRGAAAVAVKQVKIEGFDGDAACPPTTLRPGGVTRCEPTLKVPAQARMTEPYWHRDGEAGRYTFDADAPFGLPFRPTPFYAQVTLGMAISSGAVAGTEEVVDGLPIEYRYQGDIFGGEKRMELKVVPAFSVRMTPEIAIVPADAVRAPASPPVPTSAPARRGRPAARPGTSTPAAAARPPALSPAAQRELRVTVVNGAPGPAESSVKLELPEGWTAEPSEQALKFTKQDESQTKRFIVKPAPGTAPNEYKVRAVVSAEGASFDRGYEVIEYPHIHRRHIYQPAETRVKVIDVKTAPNLTIGYVMGVGDEVPPAIEQLGAKLDMVSADDLAWGDLGRFDAIVTGVRAYERRQDLRSNNDRLLDYVRNGGTLVVQYNKFEFNSDQYGPYPAKVSADRVTDESSPVTVLDPANPLFNFPNKIGSEAWKGWVQERGLYFLGDRDSRYRDLLQLQDPFPYNPGPKRGALVEAPLGKGHWIYVGLGLWRQLPAGTDGAYELLANLLSLGKSPVERVQGAAAGRPSAAAGLR